MKTIVKKDGREFECKLWNGCLENYIDIGIREVIYPNRKYFKCGFLKSYATFSRNVNEYYNLNAMVRDCMKEYLVNEKKEKIEKELKKTTYTLDKVIEM